MKYAIGIDFGATNIRVALGDNRGKIIKKIKEKTKKSAIPNQILEMISFLTDTKNIRGIGIACTGPIKGWTVKPPNLPVKSVSLKPISKLKVPVYLLNDCNASVLGEHLFGAGKGVDNLVYITLSTGIGGGAIVDNHLLFGKDKNAAEIGHITIDFDSRLKCGCGKYGHWEAYCSGKNIPNFARLWLKKFRKEEIKKSLLFKSINGNLSNLTPELIFKSANAKDKLSLRFVDEIGRLNAIGISNVTNIYDPELITLGGAITLQNPELVLKPIKKYIDRYSFNRKANIKITPLKDDAALYGVIASVLKKINAARIC